MSFAYVYFFDFFSFFCFGGEFFFLDQIQQINIKKAGKLNYTWNRGNRS